LANIPLILETPTFEETDVWRREMELLYELQEVTGTDEEVEAILKEMTDKWREELKEMRVKSGKGPKEKKGKASKGDDDGEKPTGKKTPVAKKRKGKKESDEEDD
jgi:AP endonuclease-1